MATRHERPLLSEARAGRGVRRRAAGIAAAIAVVLSGSLEGQSARSSGAPSAQLLQQLQQLAAERTSLQSENDRMKQELDAVRKERDALKESQKTGAARARSSQAALAQGAAQREAVEQDLRQTKERMEQLVAKFRETIQTLRSAESEGTAARQTLATRDQQLKLCTQRNLALYKIDAEVLDRLEHQSVWSRVAAAEPFTRLKRIELENLVDDYKARADDERVTPETLKSVAPAVPPQAAPAAPPPPPPSPGSEQSTPH
jgi:chromosome segregation ATPase